MASELLCGVRIVVTRASDQVSSLARALNEHGATVIEVPTIAIVAASDGGEALRRAIEQVGDYDWVVVTSPNGARRVVEAAGDPDRLSVRVAAVGPGTAATLAELGVSTDLVPERFVAEGLLEAFPAVDGEGRVLLAQAAGARPVLAEGLANLGWSVDAVEAYRTVNPPVAPELAEAALGADIVTFTSASTVTGLMAGLGGTKPSGRVVCIGPITADAAHAAGLEVSAVADPYTIDGLVDAVLALARVLGK